MKVVLIHGGELKLSTSVLPRGFDNKEEHQMRQAAQNSGNTFYELFSCHWAYITLPRL